MREIADLMTAGLYVTFAIQLVSQMDRSAWGREKNRSLLVLMAVFVLCAFVGYVSHALPVPHMVALSAHLVLVAATAWLVVFNHARAVAAMLNGR